MLSKSQARAFFIGFTVLFSGVFLFLTVDTIRQIPARSHEDKLTAEVVAGKMIWEANNCMGCHTILGEGAYYAPELTRVVERRGEPWLRIFLADPQAMYPGRRKMVQYDFTETQISELIAFFTWIGQIDTNGFPKKPDMSLSGIVVPSAAAAGDPAPLTPVSNSASVAVNPNIPPSPVFFEQVCKACHALGGQGGAAGPALDGVAKRLTPEAMDTWLKNPQAVKPGTAMPNLNLPDATRAELVAWLSQLH